MSGPISDWLDEMADRNSKTADDYEEQARDILGDDTVLNDWQATEALEDAADARAVSDIFEGMADAARWLGF